MIEWERLEAGHYKSKNINRFAINQKSYGSYRWTLADWEEIGKSGYFKGIYYMSTLLECKLKAEQIIADEKRKTEYQEPEEPDSLPPLE